METKNEKASRACKRRERRRRLSSNERLLPPHTGGLTLKHLPPFLKRHAQDSTAHWPHYISLDMIRRIGNETQIEILTINAASFRSFYDRNSPFVTREGCDVFVLCRTKLLTVRKRIRSRKGRPRSYTGQQVTAISRYLDCGKPLTFIANTLGLSYTTAHRLAHLIQER